MKEDRHYLQHIWDSIERIEEYLGKIKYEEFERKEIVVSAVLRELQVIGEAAGKLSAEFRRSHPEIPYLDMKDMRNFLIHEYFDVNRKIVWDTCKRDLKKLKETLLTVI